MELPVYKIKKTISNYPTSKISEEGLYQFEIFLYNDFPKKTNQKDELELFSSGDFSTKNIVYNNNFSEYNKASNDSHLNLKSFQKGYLMPVPRAINESLRKEKMSGIIKDKSEIDASVYEDFNNILSNAQIEKSYNNIGFDEMTYCWSKPITELLSWSAREKEWYFSEKRLLFASSKREIRDTWFNVFNIFLSIINSHN